MQQIKRRKGKGEEVRVDEGGGNWRRKGWGRVVWGGDESRGGVGRERTRQGKSVEVESLQKQFTGSTHGIGELIAL
ncbi:hypothetical protein ACH5RR_026518 [Cinchona calisaya]|uniref:Uncharacterized protein n=1 Tax=Cinchona calisaya TaxID=153742 RepID=A0ABD2Z2T5_9GENT